MKLTDQIEAMRVRMLDEHANAKRLLAGLEKRIEENDAELIATVRRIAETQEANATVLVDELVAIAARLGHLPPPAGKHSGDDVLQRILDRRRSTLPEPNGAAVEHQREPVRA